MVMPWRNNQGMTMKDLRNRATEAYNRWMTNTPNARIVWKHTNMRQIYEHLTNGMLDRIREINGQFTRQPHDSRSQHFEDLCKFYRAAHFYYYAKKHGLNAAMLLKLSQ